MLGLSGWQMPGMGMIEPKSKKTGMNMYTIV